MHTLPTLGKVSKQDFQRPIIKNCIEKIKKYFRRFFCFRDKFSNLTLHKKNHDYRLIKKLKTIWHKS